MSITTEVRAGRAIFTFCRGTIPAVVEIPIPASLKLSFQDEALLQERFLENAKKLISKGAIGPHAGWFQDL
jgi:hypothetical protein